MVELLLQWGADTRYRTVLGDTAVTVAQVTALRDIYLMLLKDTK